MRAAPPADHPVAGLGLWAWAGSALAALATATPMWWLVWHGWLMRLGGYALVWGGLTFVAFMAASAAWLWWRVAARKGPQHLRWDGAGWQLLTGDGAEELGVPGVRIDLGHAVLLWARGADGRAVWLPLERRNAPATWHRLRVALAQPVRLPATPAAASGSEGALA